MFDKQTGDPIGYALAFISLAPFAILVSFVTLILFKRELDTILFFIGQLINELINHILKSLIREQRPLQVLKASHSPTSFGNPSSHSQFISFFTFYSIIFILIKMKSKPKYFKYPIIVILLLSMALVIYSRIYLLYHFWHQCFVGLICGFIFSIIWFNQVYHLIEPYLFDTIISMEISQFFGLIRFKEIQDKKMK